MTRPRFQVFDHGHSDFDHSICRHAQKILRAEFTFCPRPTLGVIANRLGIDQQRLTRILKALGLWAEYRKIRKRAFKKYQCGAGKERP